jgi:hypothetical protein
MRLIAITINQLIDYLKAKVRNNERWNKRNIR